MTINENFFTNFLIGDLNYFPGGNKVLENAIPDLVNAKKALIEGLSVRGSNRRKLMVQAFFAVLTLSARILGEVVFGACEEDRESDVFGYICLSTGGFRACCRNQ